MEDPPRAVRVLSRKKKLAFTAVALVLAWPVVELVSLVILHFFEAGGIPAIHQKQDVFAKGGITRAAEAKRSTPIWDG